MYTFPETVDFARLWGGHLDLLPGVPLCRAAGPVAAANGTVILFLLLCGYGTYALAFACCRRRLPSVAAALLYMLSPVVLHEALSGRVEELSLGLSALFMLHAGSWVAKHRRRDLVLALGFFCLSLVGYLGSAILLAPALPVLGLGWLLGRRWLRDDGQCRTFLPERRVMLWRGLCLGAGMLVVLGVAWATVGTRLGTQWTLDGLSPDDAVRQARAAWLATSDQFRVRPVELFSILPLGVPSWLGLVAPLAALLGLLLHRPELPTRPLWIATLLLLFLSLGPTLGALPDGTEISSPYRILPHVLPFFLRFHWPYRFLLLASLLIAVLAAIGLGRLCTLLDQRPGRLRLALLPPLCAILLAWVQVYRLVPLPVWEVPELPRIYARLQHEPPGAVFERSSDLFMLYNPFLAQVQHRRPLCCLDLPGGLYPPGILERRARDPFFRLMSVMRAEPDGPRAQDVPESTQVREYSKLGFSHIVFHRAATAPPPDDDLRRHRDRMGHLGALRASDGPTEQLLRRLFGPPIDEEGLPWGRLQLYRIPR